ncbi:MAG: sensor histidine kinase [Oxalobacteraceae bacterium]|nr:MAG: sensor histidine kinase [Oxalobacteraceae bacterium]
MIQEPANECPCIEAVYAKELSHRAANALQHAIAAVHLSRRGGADLDDVMDRLHAVAALHHVLARSGGGLVNAADEISDVCAASVLASGAGDDIRVTADLHAVLAATTVVRPILMIVAELVANAVKHAFPDNAGTIHLEMRHRGMATLLVVEDDGVCCGWHRPGGQGGGIVDALVLSAGGRVDRSLTPGGGSRIEIVLPSLAAASSAPMGHA